MKLIITLLAFTALLIGCGTNSTRQNYSGIPPTSIVVTVSCSDPNMGFSGTIVTDGRTNQLSGIGSGTFNVTGHEFVCSFKKEGANGLISISASEDGKVLGNSRTPHDGVRAEFLRTPSAEHTVFTTF